MNALNASAAKRQPHYFRHWADVERAASSAADGTRIRKHDGSLDSDAQRA